MKHYSISKRKTLDSRRRGITLVEVVISTLLVGFLVVAAMRSVGGVFLTWQVTEDQFDGHNLAQDLMSEILQTRYYDPDDNGNYGTEAGEATATRVDFDDTDDYDDWTASPPEAKDGTALAGYAGWTRSVLVQKIQPQTPSTTVNDNANDTDLRQIIVTVTDPQSNQTTLVSFRTHWGAVEQAPAVDTTYVTWAGVELQVGSSTAVSSGTNMVNHAEDL